MIPAQAGLNEDWQQRNDSRDWVLDADNYCYDGDEFDKAQLFQDYIDNNDFE